MIQKNYFGDEGTVVKLICIKKRCFFINKNTNKIFVPAVAVKQFVLALF